MTNENSVFDVTIVGAGPVGLFATFYSGMRQMKIHLMDSLPQVGGQLMALYPEKYIYDMPGFPRVLAKDLVDQMWEQAQLGKPKLSLNTKITKIEQVEKDGGKAFRITTVEEDGSPGEHWSKTVILALGIGAFTPRKMETPGLAEREGKNVHYVLKPLDFYSNKEVLVIGGGDSAMDWTLAMAAPDDNGKVRCKATTLIHRGAKFTAHEASVEQVHSTGAKVHMQHELVKLEDAPGGRLLATLVNNQTKEQNAITVDDVIICTGYVAKLDFVKESGLAMQGTSVIVDTTMQTNVPGIFAVGDVCTHPAKLKLIATGVGEAAIAANFAKVFIDPKAKAFPGHSTTKLDPNAGKTE